MDRSTHTLQIESRESKGMLLGLLLTLLPSVNSVPDHARSGPLHAASARQAARTSYENAARLSRPGGSCFQDYTKKSQRGLRLARPVAY